MEHKLDNIDRKIIEMLQKNALGDFLPVLPFFPLLFIYTVVWSLFCNVDVMWM